MDLIADILAEVEREAPGLEPIRQTHELVRRLLTRMIEDAISETIRRIAAAGVATADDVAAQDGPMVAFSAGMAAAEKTLKRTLHRELYADVDVLQARDKAGQVVADLFTVFANDPALLPDSWRDPADEEPRRLRRTCDYIAGMTDRFALREHTRLVGNTPELKEWHSAG